MQLIVDEVSFQYPQNEAPTLQNINLNFQSGETVAIIGQNGAGKTTLVKMLNGLLKPTSGKITVDGMETRLYTTARISRKVGYVFQNPDDQIFNSDVYTEVAFSPKYFGWDAQRVKEAVKQAVDITQIREYLREHPYNLPYSMRKFVTIACILAMETEAVIFDEPTAGQDLRGIRVLEDIIRYLKEKGKLVIIITHDMEFAVRNFERVIAMADGKVIMDGTSESIFSSEEVLKKANLSKPHVARAAEMLCLKEPVLTIEQFVKTVRNLL